MFIKLDPSKSGITELPDITVVQGYPNTYKSLIAHAVADEWCGDIKKVFILTSDLPNKNHVKENTTVIYDPNLDVEKLKSLISSLISVSSKMVVIIDTISQIQTGTTLASLVNWMRYIGDYTHGGCKFICVQHLASQQDLSKNLPVGYRTSKHPTWADLILTPKVEEGIVSASNRIGSGGAFLNTTIPFEVVS